MCRRGEWNGFSTTHVSGTLCIIEQCSTCKSYRARVAEDIPVIRPENNSQQQSKEIEQDGESADHEGW